MVDRRGALDCNGDCAGFARTRRTVPPLSIRSHGRERRGGIETESQLNSPEVQSRKMIDREVNSPLMPIDASGGSVSIGFPSSYSTRDQTNRTSASHGGPEDEGEKKETAGGETKTCTTVGCC